MLFIAIIPKIVVSMEFRVFFQPELRINVLIAEGPIISGDAKRFLDIVSRADRDEEGHVILVLNSLGGSVDAAFELVRAMDKIGVFTLVPDNALCASACASIIYPSGIRRNIVGTGRLGFHSCYTKNGNTFEESAFCNELIAQHAVSRGVAHASVNLFVQDFKARDMAWVDREVACSMLIGMCRPTLLESAPSTDAEIRPSFDCRKSSTLVEDLICKHPEISRLDVRMSIAYFTLRARNDFSRDLLIQQRAWLRQVRNRCANHDCLVEQYKNRIDALEGRLN